MTYRDPGLRHLLLVAALCLAVSACFLQPKKKTGNKARSGAELLDVTSVVFDRIGDGTTARIQFKTKKPALCEMAFYSQDPALPPTKENPTVGQCANVDAGRVEFTEKLEGLRTDSLYNFVITIWEVGSSKEKGERVPFKEPSGSSNAEDPNAKVPEGKLKDLFIARLDVPLRTAEVHRHTLKDATDVATIRQSLARKTGCRAGVPNEVMPYGDANKDVAVQNLLTRDFAAAAATKHPNYPERLQLLYSSVNDGLDKWSLTYQISGRDNLITARPISRLVTMEMESTEITQFEEAQLAEAADAMKINPAKPLKLSWTTGNKLVEQSYLTVTIGRAGQEKAVYCVFPAAKRTAEIDAKLLQGLEDGRHVILAELTTSQMWVKEGWIVSVTDWRSSRIEK